MKINKEFPSIWHRELLVMYKKLGRLSCIAVAKFEKHDNIERGMLNL